MNTAFLVWWVCDEELREEKGLMEWNTVVEINFGEVDSKSIVNRPVGPFTANLVQGVLTARLLWNYSLVPPRHAVQADIEITTTAIHVCCLGTFHTKLCTVACLLVSCVYSE